MNHELSIKYYMKNPAHLQNPVLGLYKNRKKQWFHAIIGRRISLPQKKKDNEDRQ